MKLTVVNQNANFWDAKSDTAISVLPIYGYTLFLKDGTTDEFKRVIYANGQPQSNSEAGYAFVQEVPPNAGFSNTGNTIDWIRGDAGLQAVADAYGIDNPMTYAGLLGLKTSNNYNLQLLQNITNAFQNKGISNVFSDSTDLSNNIKLRVDRAIQLNGTDNYIDTQFYSPSEVSEIALHIEFENLDTTANRYIYDTTLGANGIGIFRSFSQVTVFGYLNDGTSFTSGAVVFPITTKSITVHFSLSLGLVRVYFDLQKVTEIAVSLPMQWDNSITDLIGDRQEHTAKMNGEFKRVLRSSEALTEVELLNDFIAEDVNLNYDYRFHFQELNSDLVIDAENGLNGILSGTQAGTRIILDRDDTTILFNQGYSLFENDSDNSLAYFVYDKLGNPSVLSKVGYTKINEVLKNNFSNSQKYRYAYHPDLAVITGLQSANVLDGNLNPTISINELNNIVNEELITVTKNGDFISGIASKRIDSKRVFIKRTDSPISPPTAYTTEQLDIYVELTSTLFQHYIYVHEVDTGSSLYLDYWRIGGCVLADYNGNDFTDRVEILLTEFESEFTTLFTGEAVQTGGAHGKERIDLESGDGIVFLIDGVNIELSNIPTAYYLEGSNLSIVQNSHLYKEADKSILASHIKNTTFGEYGYTTTNEITLSVSYEMFMYAGLVCIGKDVSEFVADESLNYIATSGSNSELLGDIVMANKEGYFKSETNNLFAHVSNYLDDYGSDANTQFYITDRIFDSKYYRNTLPFYHEAGKSFLTETKVKFNTNTVDSLFIIPESDLRVTLEDGVFTDWAVQPYESDTLKYNTGEILYDVNGEKLYPLKEF